MAHPSDTNMIDDRPATLELWEVCSSLGNSPTFASPDELLLAATEYFVWAKNNPLYASELVKYQGKATVKTVPKLRILTITALCLFLDIDRSTWYTYANFPEYSSVCKKISYNIKQQKISGAAADMLNPNIVAREMGLADKKELTGPNGGPLQTETRMTNMPPAPKDLADWERQTREAAELVASKKDD